MTESTDADDERIEVTYDNYEMMRDALRQSNAEGWIPVVRRDDDAIEARPVDRQNDLVEGERIESDHWLIREENGDTYTVSQETFDDRYEMSGSLRSEQFVMDLSYENETMELPDDEDVVVEGVDVVAEVSAIIHVPTQTVVTMEIGVVDYKQDNYRGMEGIPLELLYDSPLFNQREDDD